MTEYEFHPVCVAFPCYSPEVYAARLDDYRRHPERASDTAALIAQDEADGKWKIADGRHHYLICKELGYECEFQRFTGTPAELAEIVLGRNAYRRHSDASQIAAAIVAVTTWVRGGDRGNQHTGGKESRDSLPTQSEAAQEAGISLKTLSRANKVATAAPELLPAMRDGKLDVKTAERVAKLPKKARDKVAKAKDPKKAATEALKQKAEPDGEKKPEPDAPADDKPAAETHPADAACEELGRICRILDVIKSNVKAVAADPHGRHVHCESVVSQIEAARKALWQARPSAACNCVRGGTPANAACKACGGTGRTVAARVLKGGR